jgi:restriction endonuclease Mrr
VLPTRRFGRFEPSRAAATRSSKELKWNPKTTSSNAPVDGHGARKGVFITTSTLTASAKQYVDDVTHK